MNKTQQLQEAWRILNRAHFDGELRPVPIRITTSRRTYGYFHAPNNGGQPSIRVSTVLATTPELLTDTLKHEMIHQWLHQAAIPTWYTHGDHFQEHHMRIFGTPYEEAT